MDDSQKIKVLIVDDSISVRNLLENYLSYDPKISVIGKASNPYEAAEIMKTQIPDVITLDIEMPRMNGLTFLKKIMSQHPIPVIIVSSLTSKGADATIKALEYGAVEILQKPIQYGNTKEETIKFLSRKIKAAHLSRIRARSSKSFAVNPKLSADAILQKTARVNMQKSTEKIVAIGASTGGTEAILEVLQRLDKDAPGIVVVQHMPVQFTAAFAKRLNEICQIYVKEAENGDYMRKGLALIAPGDKHLSVENIAGIPKVKLLDGPPVNRHKPSVDVLFRSMANRIGSKGMGILLTGMGDDGAKGLLEMKESGAQTITQDEKSCVVYGMPKEAVKLNAQLYSMNLIQIAEMIKRFR
jgi:two-component system chemotaxis response regulator CheB